MIFNRKFLPLFLFVFAFIGNYTVSANYSVLVKDTLIPRGEIYSIPVLGAIELEKLDSLQVEFEFNPFIIDIKSASINSSYPLNGAEIVFYSNLTPSIGKFTVKVKNINVNSINSTLFDLNIEGLVSADSITDLKITALIINGVNEAFTAGNAIIKVPGEVIVQKYPEGLFLNFPNPFRGTTTFPLNIETKSTAKFKLYSAIGTEIFDESNIVSRLKLLQVLKEGGNKEIKDLTQELEPGKYYLVFNADESVLASGHLILVMKTNKDSYSKSFLFLK